LLIPASPRANPEPIYEAANERVRGYEDLPKLKRALKDAIPDHE